MVLEGNRSIYSVSKDLGVNSQTLTNWIKEHKQQQDPDHVRIQDLERQLKAEKRRTAELEEAVVILKKATALFLETNRK
ncbi:MAG: hypothetical protein DDT33_01714 [Firmicutes bacterium]|nr:hypothetical protein [Bacillota bacterium]